MKAKNLLLWCCFAVGFSFGQTDIASVEYFFDTDPGIGNGNSININPNLEFLNQTLSISTIGLSVGTHRLFVRVVNVDGTVSLVENKTFRVAHISDNNASDIIEAEYFFNQDPGIGTGTAIDVVDGAIVNETLSIPISSLSVGTHRLFVRTKNSANEYSLYDHKTFRVAHIPDNNTSDIIEAEYFFNQDPGIGMGTAIDVVDGAIVNETLSIPISSLSVGTHRLFVRTKNSANEYSLYDHKTFRVAHIPDNNTSDIIEAEYFFNQDPGIGMGTAIDVVDGAIVNETLSMPISSLSVGTHRLFVRAKNSANEYSLYDHKTFRVAHIPDNNTFDIVAAEYFIDVDPGIGNGNTLGVSGDSIDSVVMAVTPGSITQGDHFLYIRVQNSQGDWSLYERQEFEIDGVLNIEEEQLIDKIKIYPNPVDTTLKITLTTENKLELVEFYDLTGKVVFLSKKHTVNISHLSSGVYLVKLRTTKGILTKRIVKK